ncbi:MAG: hypothetical protein ACRC9L_01920 [Brevinema sp.]
MRFQFNIDIDERMDSQHEQLLLWEIGALQGPKSETYIWDRAIFGLTNDLAYSVLLPGGQGLSVQKNGTISIAGNILNAFMPSTNLKNDFNPTFYITNWLNQEEVVEIYRESWDFVNNDGENTPPFFIKAEEPVRRILRWYEDRIKAEESTLFWFQHLRIRAGRKHRNLRTITDLAGVYDIDPSRGLLRRAIVVGDIFLTVPSLSLGSRNLWTLHLNGVFTLGEQE